MPAPLPKLAPAALLLAFAGALAAATPAHAQAQAPAGKASAPASLSASSPDAQCAALRKRYLESQACFEHYRVANGAVRPEGFKRCEEVVDPSPRCGQNLPTR